MFSRFSRVWLFVTPQTVAIQAPLSMGFPGKHGGVGSHVLLQGIFPTQGSKLGVLCLLHWQAGSLPLSQSERSPGHPWCWATGFSPQRKASPKLELVLLAAPPPTSEAASTSCSEQDGNADASGR